MAKILLVEDDTNLSEIYQARMEAEGYTVVAASDGESALALAAKEKPDLVISDVMMPKISGFEMLDILRNTDGLKRVKVIMLTALGQADDRTRAENLGADKYLVKSQVTLEDIVSAAHELLGADTQLPTPAELAMPAIPQPSDNSNGPSDSTADATVSNAASDSTAAGTTTSDAASDLATGVAAPEPDPVTGPAQPAPSGPLSATVPAAMPAVEPAGFVVESADALTPAAAEPATSVPEPATAPISLAATQPPTDMEVASVPAPQPTPALETVLPAPETPIMPAPSAPAESPAPVTIETATPSVTEAPETPMAQIAPMAPMAATTPEAESPSGSEATDKPADEAEAPAEPALLPVAQPIDENMVADAIDKLLAKSPSNAGIVPPADDTTPASAHSSDHSDHHQPRVIAPLSHPETPSLQELLAKEAAQHADTGVSADTPAPASIPGTVTSDQPTTASPVAPLQPNPTVSADTSEEDADAALLAKAQAENAARPKSETPSTGFDPRNMTL